MRLTLNLLPPEKKKALRTGVVLTFVQSMALIVCVTALVIAANLLYVRFWLKREHASVGRHSIDSAGEFSTFAKDIAELNGHLGLMRDVNDAAVPWSEVLTSVAATAGAGVRLDSLAFTSKAIAIEGLAATRDDVLRMKERLEALPFATGVDSPLSNILQRTDARFSFTVSIDAARISP